ncbi:MULTISPECIES: FecR domain-containing protein [Gammaproteobacteria]|uniref:FecR family protein n=1 Tax=Gammaproteobacteria TaxID=1236 RepID=UPI000DD0D30B|nr:MULTISPECIES: FecR family protein [Gammaproteobacteria]RTE85799.1 hypothetical protein DQX04_10130 [Aliidiomarina sp. B3213]TCZ90199.1 hypothetical protein EYQ95_10325 [Lysobacter sp. N42]
MFSNLFNAYRANHVGVFLASCLIVVACFSSTVSAQESDTETAGQLLFTHGTVEITRNEETTSASRGEDLFNQDLLITGTASSAQIRFSDNSLIAVRPETEFLIENYAYDETNPENGRQSTQLIRGSLRAMTGAIGQARPENVEFKTPVATMGIRGTVLSIVHIPEGSGNSELASGTYLQVESGSVEVVNNSGAQLVNAGQTVYVENENTAPAPASNDAVNYFASQQTQQDDENDEENDDSSKNNDGNNNNNSGSGTSNSSSSSSNNNPSNQNSGTTTPPDDANTNQGEDDIEENTPEPEPLPEFGLDFSPYGIFGILAGGDITPTGEFTIGDYSTPALRFDGGETFESGYFNTNQYYPGSNSDINWARWAYGDYELVNSILEDVDTGHDFMYLLTNNPITDLGTFNDTFNSTSTGTTSNLRFSLANSPGISLSNGESLYIGEDSYISVGTHVVSDLAMHGTVQIVINFGFSPFEANYTMSNLVGFAQLFDTYIRLIERGSNVLLADGKLWLVPSGNETWGLDAFLAALEVELQNPESDIEDKIKGYGMLAFVNDCIVNFPCPYFESYIPGENAGPNSEYLGSNGQVTIHTDSANTFLSVFGESAWDSIRTVVAKQNADKTSGVLLTEEEGLVLGEYVTINGVNVFWGHWLGGSYQIYDTPENEVPTWLDNNTNYHYIWVSESINTSPSATGEMQFEMVGGSGLVSDSSDRVFDFQQGDITVNFDENSMGVVLIFEEGEGENKIEAILEGTNLDLLAFLNNEQGITLVTEDGPFDSASMFGGFAGEGLDALIAMLEASLGDETFRGTGVFESYEVAEDLPEWGTNFSPYGIFAELAEGTTFPSQSNILDFYSTSSLTFEGLIALSPDNFSQGGFSPTGAYYNANSNIQWARWANGYYTLYDSLGETVETPFDFMYLVTDSLIASDDFTDIVSQWHTGQNLTFSLFDSPGVTLSNGNSFSIGSTSHISLDTESQEIKVVIDFSYDIEEFDGSLEGQASFADLFNTFIALTLAGENSRFNFDGTRLVTAFSGSDEWGVDSILTSLFILFEDEETQEQVEGYGMLAFVYDCVVNFPCPAVGSSESLANNDMESAATLGGNLGTTVRSNAQNSYMDEGLRLLAQLNQSQELSFLALDSDGFGLFEQRGTSLNVGDSELFFVWGYWEADSYDLYENGATFNDINPLSTSSNYHYILVTESYTDELPSIGVRNYEFVAGSGLVSESDGSVMEMTEGQISVDFEDESLGLLFIFDNDNNEVTLRGSVDDLWAFLNNGASITLEGQDFDSGSIAGSFAGANMEALMALIQATFNDNQYAGTGVFAYTPPIDVDEYGTGLTLSGFLGNGATHLTYTGEGNNFYFTGFESEDLIFVGEDFNINDQDIPLSFVDFSMSDWNLNSSNRILWGVWDAGSYSLVDSAGYERTTTQPFVYLYASEQLGTVDSVETAIANNHSTETTMKFRFGGGESVFLSNGEFFNVGPESSLTLDLSDNSMDAFFSFGYTAEGGSVARFLEGSGSIEDFFNSYIRLDEEIIVTSSEAEEVSAIVDFARLYGIFGGSESSGIDSILAGLYVSLIGNEPVDGFGMFYFLYCWMGNSCDIPNSDPSNNVGTGLSIAGYLERERDLSNSNFAALGSGGTYPTYLQNSELTFNASGDPDVIETVQVSEWNEDSSTEISWGLFSPEQYTLTNSNGNGVTNDHYFPYLFSDQTLSSPGEVETAVLANHSAEGTMTFKLGGGTGVNLSNGEVIALDESSRVYIDVNAESVTFELDFTYSAEELEIIRTLFGNGSVEEFYNSYIELEETSSANKIVELARMYGALTGNEETGIDALLTGLFLAIKDASGNNAHGFGLHYFLYCWMGNTCEEEVVELAYGGLMDYGYFPSATIGSQFYSTEDALGSSVWHPEQLADENRVFRLEDTPTNTNMFLSSAYHANSGPGQASYWGFYDTGTWNFYDLGDSDYLEPLNGSGSRPFHYAFTFDPFNLNTFADADVVLDGYTGPMSFRLLGATPVHFASGEYLATQSSSSVTVDPINNTVSFQIDVAYSGEGFDFIHKLAGTGDIEALYNHFIELTDQSSNPIVDTARIFGQLTGTNIGAGTIGNMNNYQNVGGLLAALLVSLIGEETDFGMGTIAFAHCYLNNDCSFTNLPTIPGMNLTNAGILDRSLAQMASEGTTVVEEVSAGFSAPTHVETQAYTFTVDEFAIPLYYDTYDLSFMDSNIQNRIHLGIWEGGSYTLLNQWGDEMDNSADMPYLFSDNTLGSSYMVETIAGANHSGVLQFDLFQGTGMQLSNNATFALLAGSHLQLDLDAESISEQISVSLEYFYDTAMTPSYLTGSGSVAQLYEGFIALNDLGSDIDYNDARFYGSFAGDMSWGLDSFLAGLYVDFLDGSEHVTGYGQFAFLSCLLSMPGYTETNIASGCGGGGGFDPSYTLVSDYYVGKSPAVFAVNNSMGYRALDTGENSAFFDIFQNGNPVLVSSGEAFYGGTGYLFNIISENPTADWDGGTEYVDTLGGVEQEEVQWGYWAPNSYELEESYDEYTQYPLDTNDRFFYMVVSDTTDVTMLPILQSEIGSATFALSGGSGGLINTQNGNFSALTGGSLYVDFTGETFDVDLQFGAGNSLSALEADIFALFNYTPITLDGTGVFGGGSLQGTFVGPEAEGVAAMISAWLTANEETLRGITVFERIP